MAACCVGSRLSQMDAKCPRSGGGGRRWRWERPAAAEKGRSPGVRPALEPVLARRSVAGIGERSRSRWGAEGGGEAVRVPVLGDVVAEVVE